MKTTLSALAVAFALVAGLASASATPQDGPRNYFAEQARTGS